MNSHSVFWSKKGKYLQMCSGSSNIQKFLLGEYHGLLLMSLFPSVGRVNHKNDGKDMPVGLCGYGENCWAAIVENAIGLHPLELIRIYVRGICTHVSVSSSIHLHLCLPRYRLAQRKWLRFGKDCHDVYRWRVKECFWPMSQKPQRWRLKPKLRASVIKKASSQWLLQNRNLSINWRFFCSKRSICRADIHECMVSLGKEGMMR